MKDKVDSYIRRMENNKYNNLHQFALYENLVRQKDQQLLEMDAIMNKKSVKAALKLEAVIKKIKPLKFLLKGIAKVVSKLVHLVKPKKEATQPCEEEILQKTGDVLIVAPEAYETSVSVIYPTKNGGALFEQSIQSIISQLCIGNIEVIVVDSGSSDDTMNIARFLGAKVIEIQPEDFSHSYARNLGAKHATGEYLLFMTQDAIPTDDLWLYRLITPLMEGKVVAASPRETQREYGDLKYKIDNWNHNHYLGIMNQDVIGSMPGDANFDSLRKNAQLADISCLVRKNVFEKYGYAGDFAEDLRLGLDIIRGGEKIALMSSVQVIHAHERIASYYMKRNFVDVATIKDIFPDYPIRNRTKEQLISAIQCGYFYTKQIIAFLDDMVVDDVNGYFHQLLKKIEMCTIDQTNATLSYEDDDMKQVMKQLFSLQENYVENKEMCEEIKGYIFGGLQNYILSHYDRISHELSEEIKETIYKTFCGNAGIYITEYCIINEDKKDRITELGNRFREGV
ncbi:MAG: glycosyltransferase family 2 protein [Lachnospiraceae bacterium]